MENLLKMQVSITRAGNTDRYAKYFIKKDVLVISIVNVGSNYILLCGKKYRICGIAVSFSKNKS